MFDTATGVFGLLQNKLETRATCRGIVDKATADPAVHKRMTAKYMLDVFGGSGILTKVTCHLGLLGYVLNTKFGSRYDVTKLFDGQCVAGMISPPLHHTGCHPKVMGASAPIATCFIVGFSNTRVIRGCGTYGRSRNSSRSLGLGPGGFLYLRVSVQESNVIFTVMLASVLGQVDVAVFSMNNIFIQKLPDHRRDHTRPLRLSFALAMVLTMNARRFQRTHSFRGMGDYSVSASKDFG